jgi:putative endonuclease
MTRSLKRKPSQPRAAVQRQGRKRSSSHSRGTKQKKIATNGRKIVRTGQFFVYIVECSDGSFYTGYTKDLPARLKLHNAGRGSKYVRSKRPVSLVFAKQYRYYKHAVKEERRIKTLSRKQKESLTAGYRIS